LELVVDEAPRRNSPWRPTTLTLRRFLRIVHLIEKGWPITRACQAESVSYAHFRFRVSRSKRLEQRLKRAEDVRFALRHEEAVATVLAASQHSWPAAAWFLERSAPGRWALKSNVVRGDPEQDKELEEEIPAEVLVQRFIDFQSAYLVS
jgi:hypothetical protein